MLVDDIRCRTRSGSNGSTSDDSAAYARRSTTEGSSGNTSPASDTNFCDSLPVALEPAANVPEVAVEVEVVYRVGWVGVCVRSAAFDWVEM